MKIAFYKGLGRSGTGVDKLICLATLSPYSHCEIVFSDGVAASASIRDKGVRYTHIDFNSGRWDVFELNVSNSQEVLARALFNLYEGCAYDYVGALASWARIDAGTDSKFFCSKIVAIACGVSDVARSPGSLFGKLKRLHLI